MLGIDYSHFGAGGRDDETIRTAVMGATSWPEALEAAGYPRYSGTARASIRKRCAALGIDIAHLTAGGAPKGSGIQLEVSLENLPSAAPMLVAGALMLAGHAVNWPLEPAPYDLLVEARGATHRVQVKATNMRVDGTWVCRLTHSTYDAVLGRSVADVYTDDQIDMFGIVDGDLRIFVIPLHIVAGKSAIYLRHYERFRMVVPPLGVGAAPGVR
ncbi:MAG: group I intron-associated PD-(D/E)XK endonuclease [Mycobacteriales bacterium]